MEYSERILIQKNDSLVSVNSDGKDEKIVCNNCTNYIISGDNKLLICYSEKEAKLYKIQEGFSHVLIFEDENLHWSKHMCGWDNTSRKFFIFKNVTYYSDHINKVHAIDLEENKLIFIEDLTGRAIYPTEYERTRETFREVKEIISPNKAYVIGIPGTGDKLFLKKVDTGKKITIFTNYPGDKFAHSVTIPKLPWSPDSSKFILEKFEGSMFSNIWEDLTGKQRKLNKNVYVVDVQTLKWKKIFTEGMNPLWFDKFPLQFIEQKPIVIRSE